MKKILSVTLAVLLLFGLMSIMTLIPASAVAINPIVKNGGFEDGKANWTFNSNSVSTEQKSSGLKSAKLAKDNHLQQTVSLESNTDYDLRIDFYNPNGIWVVVKIIAGGSNILSKSTSTSRDGWKSYSFSFNSGENVSATIDICTSADSPEMWVDNVIIEKATYIKNGSFENGNTGWNYRTDDLHTNNTGDASDGFNSLLLQHNYWHQQLVNVEENTDYTVTFDALMVTDSVGYVMVRIFALNASGNRGTQLAKCDGAATGATTWTKKTISFNSESNSQIIIGITMDGTNGSARVDNFKMGKTTLVKNGSFENGFSNWTVGGNIGDTVGSTNASVGSKSLQLIPQYGKSYQNISVARNTYYRYSFDVYNPGQAWAFANVYNSSDTRISQTQIHDITAAFSNWATVTVVFNSGENDTIKIEFNKDTDDASKVIYVDDVKLLEVLTVDVAAEEGGSATCLNLLNNSGIDYIIKGSLITVNATANAGYCFIGWYDDEDQLVSEEETYNFKPDSAVNLTAKFVHGPAFKTRSISLSDSISLNFFIELPVLTTAEKEASYMTFSITKGTGGATVVGNRSYYDSDAVNENGYYRFTCNLSSVQMAETVTPTYHCTVEGVDMSFEGDSYSVKDYIDDIIYCNGSVFGAKSNEGLALVKAIGDYGHYAQIYLGGRNGWVAGTDYTAIGTYLNASYDGKYTAIRNAVLSEGKSVTTTNITKGWGAGQYRYRLNFDSTTSIELRIAYLTSISMTNIDYTNYSVDNSPKDYGIFLLHIPASNLSTVYQIDALIDSTTACRINISALSFVYDILNNNDSTTAAKDVACALSYYDSAVSSYLGLSSVLNMEFV